MHIRKDDSMKPAGFLCKIDKLGLIVIPKPLRDKYNIQTDDALEMFTEPEGILLRKYGMSCIFCGGDDRITMFKGKPLCQGCLDKLQNL